MRATAGGIVYCRCLERRQQWATRHWKASIHQSIFISHDTSDLERASTSLSHLPQSSKTSFWVYIKSILADSRLKPIEAMNEQSHKSQHLTESTVQHQARLDEMGSQILSARCSSRKSALRRGAPASQHRTRILRRKPDLAPAIITSARGCKNRVHTLTCFRLMSGVEACSHFQSEGRLLCIEYILYCIKYIPRPPLIDFRLLHLNLSTRRHFALLSRVNTIQRTCALNSDTHVLTPARRSSHPATTPPHQTFPSAYSTFCLVKAAMHARHRLFRNP